MRLQKIVEQGKGSTQPHSGPASQIRLRRKQKCIVLPQAFLYRTPNGVVVLISHKVTIRMS